MHIQAVLFSFLFSLFMGFSVMGNSLFMHGIQSNGMSSTYSGNGNKAEWVWLNPAIMDDTIKKTVVSTGLYVIMQSTKFQQKTPSMYQAVTDNDFEYPAYFFVTSPVNERLTVGLSVNQAFSESINWQNENWAGRYILNNMDLSTVVIQPALSYRITPKIVFGAGLILVRADLLFNKAIPYRDQNRESNMEINGKSTGIGFNSGIQVLLNPNVSIGLNYKSGMKIRFSNAQAHFQVPSSLQGFFFENNPLTISWPVAQVIDLTGSWKINDEFDLAWGLAYTLHSFMSSTEFEFALNNQYLEDFNIISNDKNRFILRAGLEYKPFIHFSFRAGSWFQKASANSEYLSPMRPYSDRLAFSTGMSLIPNHNLSIDLNFLFLAGITNNASYSPANFEGTYRSYLFLPGLGVSYSF
jgi:long-chain fatty acid transport protein